MIQEKGVDQFLGPRGSPPLISPETGAEKSHGELIAIIGLGNTHNDRINTFAFLAPR